MENRPARWKLKDAANEADLFVPNTLAAFAFERSNDRLRVREVHGSD